MLRAPIWITSATSSTASRSRTSISSVTIGRPGSACATAEQGPARVSDDPRGLQRLLARFDGARPGDDREVLRAHLAPVDLQHGALAVRYLQRGQLVGLEDRHHPIDARLALQAEAFDVDVLLDVTDRPDHRHTRAGAAMRACADSLDLLDDRLDLVLGCGLLHHDHHLLILSPTPGMLRMR